jgi:hypothetical protein
MITAQVPRPTNDGRAGTHSGASHTRVGGNDNHFGGEVHTTRAGSRDCIGSGGAVHITGADGSQTLVGSSGAVHVTGADGSRTDVGADGGVRTVGADGSRTHISSSGAADVIGADGSRVTVSSSGAVHNVDADGSQMYVSSSGAVRRVGAGGEHVAPMHMPPMPMIPGTHFGGQGPCGTAQGPFGAQDPFGAHDPFWCSWSLGWSWPRPRSRPWWSLRWTESDVVNEIMILRERRGLPNSSACFQLSIIQCHNEHSTSKILQQQIFSAVTLFP